MPDLDLSALRKVAEDYESGVKTGPHAWDASFRFRAAFDVRTVLALLDELENARITAQYDRRYIEDVDERMKPYLAKAWDAGWDEGNYYAISDFDQGAKSKNPYRQVSDG